MGIPLPAAGGWWGSQLPNQSSPWKPPRTWHPHSPTCCWWKVRPPAECMPYTCFYMIFHVISNEIQPKSNHMIHRTWDMYWPDFIILAQKPFEIMWKEGRTDGLTDWRTDCQKFLPGSPLCGNLHVCLFVCLLVYTFVCSFICLHVYLFICGKSQKSGHK